MYSMVLITLLLSFVLPPFLISAMGTFIHPSKMDGLAPYHIVANHEMSEVPWEGGGISVRAPKLLEGQVCNPKVSNIVVTNEVR